MNVTIARHFWCSNVSLFVSGPTHASSSSLSHPEMTVTGWMEFLPWWGKMMPHQNQDLPVTIFRCYLRKYLSLNQSSTAGRGSPLLIGQNSDAGIHVAARMHTNRQTEMADELWGNNALEVKYIGWESMKFTPGADEIWRHWGPCKGTVRWPRNDKTFKY